jgi:hypothetical protein
MEPALAGLGLDPEAVDLILDAGPLPNDPTVDLFVSLIGSALGSLPHLNRWRRIVVLSGSMPTVLSAVPVGSTRRLPRREWSLWTRLVAPPRVLSYGDFGIAHPESPDELANPRGIPLYAQLRYTTEETFAIVKARDVHVYGPGELYDVCQRATKLTEWDGAGFSASDSWISARAAGSGEAGNYMVWRKIGTGHHITKIVSLLASPSAP